MSVLAFIGVAISFMAVGACLVVALGLAVAAKDHWSDDV